MSVREAQREVCKKEAAKVGRYCYLYLDDVAVASARPFVPDEWRAVFQENDRVRVGQSSDETVFAGMVYETARDTFIARLELLGCSERLARERVRDQIVKARIWWGSRAEETGETAIPELTALRSLTTAEWYARVRKMVLQPQDRSKSEDIVDRKMEDEDWVWFDDYGLLIRVRALLDACPEVRRIRLDATELVDSEWMDGEGPICDRSAEDWANAMLPLAAIMVLAEGKSDIRVLEKSLAVLFPDRREYFTFFRHAELGLEGGTPFLVKMLKAFATARAPLRLVAVFDNDAAGVAALRECTDLGLPSNFALVPLPDIELGRRYPTLGPTGKHFSDVNGRAAGIELYLGKQALSVNGELRPVRWTGYDKRAGAYQGEVAGKGDVQRAFEKAMHEMSDKDARNAYPELVSVWETIFAAASPWAEGAQRHALRQQDLMDVEI